MMKTANLLQKPNITIKNLMKNHRLSLIISLMEWVPCTIRITDIYRKQITLPTGDKTRVSVSGDTPQECMEKMFQKEKI